MFYIFENKLSWLIFVFFLCYSLTRHGNPLEIFPYGDPTTGFRIPKRAGFQFFFFCFNAFPRISFSCSNLAILKDVVRMHNKFVFCFDL